jgi:hypothetical protein
LLAVACVAYAADAGAGKALDWQTVAIGAVGIAATMVGVYAKGLERRVATTEGDIKDSHRIVQEIRLMMLNDLNKAGRELSDALTPVNLQLADIKRDILHLQNTSTELKMQVGAVHSRLDSMSDHTERYRFTPATRTGD